MCFTLATMGAAAGLNTALNVGAQALSFIGEQRAANAQTDAYYRNAQAANDAAIVKYGQQLSQQREQEANYTREQNRAQIAGMNAAGSALASSMNEGNSTNLTLMDLARQTAREISLDEINKRNLRAQGADERYAIQQEAQSRINSMAPGESPDPFSALVAGLGAYAKGRMAQLEIQKDMPTSEHMDKPSVLSVPTWQSWQSYNPLTRPDITPSKFGRNIYTPNSRRY